LGQIVKQYVDGRGTLKYSQILKVATNETICTKIALENHNNNNQ